MSIKNQKNLPYFALAIILATVASLFGLNYTINLIGKKDLAPLAMNKSKTRARTLLGSDDSAAINKTIKTKQKKLAPRPGLRKKPSPTFKSPPRKNPPRFRPNQPHRRLRNGQKAADIQRSRKKASPESLQAPPGRPVYPPNVREDYFRGPPPSLPPGFPKLPPNPTPQDIENFREEMRSKIESGEIPPPPPPPPGFYPPSQDGFFPPPGAPQDYEDQMYDNMYGPGDDQNYDSRRAPEDDYQRSQKKSDLDHQDNSQHSYFDTDNYSDEDYEPYYDENFDQDIRDFAYYEEEERERDQLADQDPDFFPEDADLPQVPVLLDELMYEIFDDYGYTDDYEE